MKKENRLEMLATIQDFAMVYAYHMIGDESFTGDELCNHAFYRYRGASMMIRKSGIRKSDISAARDKGQRIGEELRLWEIQNGRDYSTSYSPWELHDRIYAMRMQENADGTGN